MKVLDNHPYGMKPALLILLFICFTSFLVIASGDKKDGKKSSDNSSSLDSKASEEVAPIEIEEAVEDYLLHPEISLEKQTVTIKVYNENLETIKEFELDKGQEIKDEELNTLLRHSDLLMQDNDTYYYISRQ